MNVENFPHQKLINKLVIITIPILLSEPFIIPMPLAKAIGFSSYCSIGQDIRIDHPLNWDLKEDYAKPNHFSFTYGNTLFMVDVFHYSILGGGGPSASLHADQLLRWAKQNLAGFSLINGDNYIIQSRSMSTYNPAYYLTYSYTWNTLERHVFQVFVHESERNYVFTLDTIPQDFDDVLPIAEQMLRSVRIMPTPLSSC